NVLAGVLLFGEDACAFKDKIDVQVGPGQVSRVAFAQVFDRVAVDNQAVAFYLDTLIVAPVYTVVLQQIGHVVNRTNVVDGHQFKLRSIHNHFEGSAANTSQPVDRYS